jgi:hypothetical protein
MGKRLEADELRNICLFIETLDSLRAFRRKSLETVKNAFLKVGVKSISQEWDRLRKDIEKIVYMPLKIPGVPKLIKAVLIMKFLFLLTLLPGFFIFMSQFLLRNRNSALLRFNWLTMLVVLILPLILGYSYIILDFSIRRKIAAYEMLHEDKFRTKKEKLKGVVQKAIDLLVERIERSKYPPEDYKLKLYFDDYRNIRVIKKSRGKIFKKKYYTFVALPQRTRT